MMKTPAAALAVARQLKVQSFKMADSAAAAPAASQRIIIIISNSSSSRRINNIIIISVDYKPQTRALID